jgi:hypothetical protein
MLCHNLYFRDDCRNFQVHLTVFISPFLLVLFRACFASNMKLQLWTYKVCVKKYF